MAKRIVICCDGTWNTPDQKDRGEVRPSNVAKIALSITPVDNQGKEQMVYYDKGVGTEWYNKLIGGVSGEGISKNILQAYIFLVDNYEDGDEVCFFGFSRGAYTVRSTVGLIRNCGLLKREHKGRLNDAYKLYRRRDDKSKPTSIEAELFRKSYSREIKIHCLGVWDTVGALGIPIEKFELTNKLIDAIHGITFHDVDLSSIVTNAFQALAIDERRDAFKPSIWKQQEHAKGKQRLEQVWFAGVHSNIGGGYQCSRLSDCAFEWMRDRAKECGLVFNDAVFADHKITVTTKWEGWNGELRDSKTGFYKLIKDYVRPIGVEMVKGDDGKEKLQFSEVQAVHETAVKRFNNSQNPPEPYQPKNLKDYLSKPTAKITL